MSFMVFSTLVALSTLGSTGPAPTTFEGGIIKVAEKTANRADGEAGSLNLEPLPSDLETSKDFNSQPIGQRKRWKFDTGYFDFDDRKSGLIEPGDNSQNYSGIRFRRPTRK